MLRSNENKIKYLRQLTGESSDKDLPAPLFRTDFYLASLCGIYKGVLPDPVTLTDILLKQYAEHPGGGVSYKQVGVTGVFPCHLSPAVATELEAADDDEILSIAECPVLAGVYSVKLSPAVATELGGIIVDEVS